MLTVSHAPPLLPIVFVVGVERKENGARRVYVGHRYKGRYVLLGEEDFAVVERAWNSGGHVCLDPEVVEGLPLFRDG